MSKVAQWKVIHMTRTEKHADEILEYLTGEGIMARAKQVYRGVASEDNYYEIRVLFSEAEEALKLLIEQNLLV